MNKELINLAESIDGWMDRVDLEWLNQNSKEKTVLEIGVYKGRSTIAMGEANQISCIDTFLGDPTDKSYKNKGESFYYEFVDNIKKVKELNGKDHQCDVIPYIGPSYQCLPLFKERLFDLIFIDASHRFDDVLLDILFAKKLIRSGGIIAGHDINSFGGYPDVKRAVEVMFGTVGYQDTMEEGGNIWFIKEKS